jgi:branched-chain amino acid transport system permease protein
VSRICPHHITRLTLFVLAGTALVLVFPVTGPDSRLIYLATSVGILSLAASGLAVLYGDSGQLSVAHGSLMGLGTYASIITIDAGRSVPTAAAAAASMGFVSAVILGIPSLRLRGHYFVITTFAAAEALAVIVNNVSVTGGPAGKSLLAPSTFLATESGLYYGVFGVLIFVIALLSLMRRAHVGARLSAIRENEVLARAVGVRTRWLKLLAFAVSGIICGVSGFFYAFANHYATPADVGSAPGIILVMILLLGGSRHWTGPIIGAIIYVGLPYVFPLSAAQNQLAIGALLIAVMVVVPRGIAGAVSASVARGREGFVRWAGGRA